MKKSLFLLPLLAGLMLCGCNDDKGGDTPTPTPTPSPTPTPTPTPGPVGELIGKVDLTNPGSKASNVTDDSCVFASGSMTITVSRGDCTQTVTQAVSASGSHEFRLYNKMSAVLSCTEAFSSFKVECTTFGDNAYIWDDPHLTGATFEFDGNITTTVHLNAASTSFSNIYAYKQVRIASISFYK